MNVFVKFSQFLKLTFSAISQKRDYRNSLILVGFCAPNPWSLSLCVSLWYKWQSLSDFVILFQSYVNLCHFVILFQSYVILNLCHSLLSLKEQACEALEIFDELMETEVAIVLPHIKSIIEFCLEIAANEKLGNAPRVRALSHLSWVISLKKKTIKKHKLVSFRFM